LIHECLLSLRSYRELSNDKNSFIQVFVSVTLPAFCQVIFSILARLWEPEYSVKTDPF
jgi:hypothetical protein